MIFIFCLFFQAKVAKKVGDEYQIDNNTKENTYSYFTFLEALQYKQTWIVLLLLIVFFYDLIQCKVITLNSMTLGISLVVLLGLMFIGYFTNTLIYKDNNKNKSSYTIMNCYKEENLEKNMMIEIDPNIYEKYRYPKGLTCNAKFIQSTLVQDAYNYPPYNVKSAIFPETPEQLNTDNNIVQSSDQSSEQPSQLSVQPSITSDQSNVQSNVQPSITSVQSSITSDQSSEPSDKPSESSVQSREPSEPSITSDKPSDNSSDKASDKASDK